MFNFNQPKSRLQTYSSKNPFKVIYQTVPNAESQHKDEENNTVLSPHSLTSQDSFTLSSPQPKSSILKRKPRSCQGKKGFEDLFFNDLQKFSPSKADKTPNSSKSPRKPFFGQIELETCKSEISQLKTEIKKIKTTSCKSKKDPLAFISHKELSLRLQQQKRDLEKQYKISFSRQKSELFKEFQEHFDNFHGKFVNRVKTHQANFIKSKSKEIEEIFAYELLVIENQFEEKLEKKVKKMEDEFESKQKTLISENSDLKKQNEKLKEMLEEYKKDKEGQGKNENFIWEERFRQINGRYEKVVAELNELKKTERLSMCQKCLAFTEVDSNLSRHLTSLKDYLELQDL